MTGHEDAAATGGLCDTMWAAEHLRGEIAHALLKEFDTSGKSLA